MATPGGRPDPPLADRLFEEPYRFDFFQAVRLLSRLRPHAPPVGREGPPAREPVRFRAVPDLSFPASAIHDLTEPADGRPPEMAVAFLGLFGPSGVLPYAYTELLMERLRRGDRTLAEFLDLFHHRLISLFYRAWEKHHAYVGGERGEGDPFAAHLFELIGLGVPSLRRRHAFADRALLVYAGIFAQRHRPAVVLEALLRDAFGLPVEVRQFEGQWLKLEPADRSALGASGPNNGLGASLILGGRVWDEQGKIRLRIGPLGFDDFRRLLPDGPALKPLVQMARLYVDAEFAIDVQLVLKAEEVPASQLRVGPGNGPRLGRYAWLKSRPMETDADQAVFVVRN